MYTLNGYLGTKVKNLSFQNSILEEEKVAAKGSPQDLE
jgi:hypothetical protein